MIDESRSQSEVSKFLSQGFLTGVKSTTNVYIVHGSSECEDRLNQCFSLQGC